MSSSSTTAASMAQCALPSKRTSYSNEDFDVAQRIAYDLTDADRKAGVPGTPRAGYSAAHYATAERAVRDWLRPA